MMNVRRGSGTARHLLVHMANRQAFVIPLKRKRGLMRVEDCLLCIESNQDMQKDNDEAAASLETYPCVKLQVKDLGILLKLSAVLLPAMWSPRESAESAMCCCMRPCKPWAAVSAFMNSRRVWAGSTSSSKASSAALSHQSTVCRSFGSGSANVCSLPHSGTPKPYFPWHTMDTQG